MLLYQQGEGHWKCRDLPGPQTELSLPLQPDCVSCFNFNLANLSILEGLVFRGFSCLKVLLFLIMCVCMSACVGGWGGVCTGEYRHPGKTEVLDSFELELQVVVS